MVSLSSYDIISECRRRHGAGKLFPRTDGLQYEERRVAQRRRFLEANPDTTASHRDAILKAAVTPGMTRGEATAAWGLLDEDTANVYGHVVESRPVVYAYFTGFNVGATYALYMADDEVAGVRETCDRIEPHPREADMKLADRYLGLFCFYELGNGVVLGTDMDEYRNPPDILAMGMHRTEPIPRFSEDEEALKSLEYRLVGHGVYSDYLEALRRMGTDVDHATLAQRCEAAASVKRPYASWRFNMP